MPSVAARPGPAGEPARRPPARSPSRLRRQALAVALLICAPGLPLVAACGGPPSSMEPRTAEAAGAVATASTDDAAERVAVNEGAADQVATSGGGHPESSGSDPVHEQPAVAPVVATDPPVAAAAPTEVPVAPVAADVPTPAPTLAAPATAETPPLAEPPGANPAPHTEATAVTAQADAAAPAAPDVVPPTAPVAETPVPQPEVAPQAVTPAPQVEAPSAPAPQAEVAPQPETAGPQVGAPTPVADAPAAPPDPPAAAGPPLFPLAVMVENSYDARPQSGLAQADVVYEALAEGGISRFMAVYMHGHANSIGPVRSARHYFMYLAAEYNASLVHIGASPFGYGTLTAIGLRNLDETFGDPGFQRIHARAAPHNAYTSTDAARWALWQRRGDARLGSWGGLRFKESPEDGPEGRNARELLVAYAPATWVASYTVRFVHEPTSNRYLRYMDDVPHHDAGDWSQLAPSNVVVLRIPSYTIDGAGRLELEQVGAGRALFLLDGKAVDGTWTKASETAPTELRDDENRPILLNRGQTWIQIVPEEAQVTVSSG